MRVTAQRLTAALDQIVAALKAKDAAAMLKAKAALTAVQTDTSIPEAEKKIQDALGFSW